MHWSRDEGMVWSLMMMTSSKMAGTAEQEIPMVHQDSSTLNKQNKKIS